MVLNLYRVCIDSVAEKEENGDDVPADTPMIELNHSGISSLAIEPTESDSELAEVNARLIAHFNKTVGPKEKKRNLEVQKSFSQPDINVLKRSSFDDVDTSSFNKSAKELIEASPSKKAVDEENLSMNLSWKKLV
jgi:hypothetical protein